MNNLDTIDPEFPGLVEDLTMLVEASSVLAGALNFETVLPRTLELCRLLIKADAYAVWLYCQQTCKWSVVCASGLSEEYQRLTYESMDNSVSLMNGPLIIEDAESCALLKSNRDLQRKESIRSLLVIPLKIAGDNAGTVVFYYKKPHTFSGAEVRIGVGIGNLVGASMTSIRMYENERALRRESEKARQRVTFLAELSTLLSQSLDLRKTLDKVVRLAVLNLPQGCSIYFRSQTGNFDQVAMAHEDANKERLQESFLRKYQPASNPDSTIKRVFESQKAVLISEIKPRNMEVPGADPAMIEMLRQLDPRSVMFVPLIARGHSVGVISFATSDPKRPYSEDDLIFAQEIARHAASMVDNARLYSEVLEADARKDQFMAMLGHELRNPLAPVLAGVDVLSNQRSSESERMETVQIIRRQVQHMSRIVDDLLDVSRISTGRMEFKKAAVDLITVVERCAADHMRLFEQRKIRFEQHLPYEAMWVDVDAIRIAQAIGNLLNNALKFTPAGGNVHLRLNRISDSEAAVSVTDTGPGIDVRLLPRLFESFSQAESGVDRGKGGLGLGLALVKGLVEGHGGRVSVSSPLEHETGSKFVIVLPLAPPGLLIGTPEGAAEKVPPQRILLIEDNVDLARTMSALLKLGGHTVAIAHSGSEGVAQAAALNPNTVLCDIGLPGAMDGLDVARHLRRSHPTIKLVALTGYGGNEVLKLSVEAGFDFHLTKPVDLKTLNSILLKTR